MPYKFGQPWTPVYRDTALAHPKSGTGSISATRPTTLTGLTQDTVARKLAPWMGKRLANKLGALSELNPITPAFDAGSDLRKGNYLSGAVGALLSMMPDGGAVAAKGGMGLLHSVITPLWHGSPHKFEKFALEKIGTGEGAQAYGHGLYFAENPEVAKQYQKTVSLQHAGVDWGNDPASAAAYWIGMTGGDRTRAARTFEMIKQQQQTVLDRAAKGLPLAPGAEANARNEIAQADAAIDHIRNGTERGDLGHLYQVKLDANPEDFLDWDAPLAEQPKAVNALQGWIAREREQGFRPDSVLGLSVKRAEDAMAGNARLGDFWRDFERQDSPQMVSHYIRPTEHGISGIRYLDQGSRAAGQGSRNYVVFDPSIIDILNRQ
jgi:hypothetical protein